MSVIIISTSWHNEFVMVQINRTSGRARWNGGWFYGRLFLSQHMLNVAEWHSIMTNTSEITVHLERGLCKLTLTAPCCDLLEVLDDPKIFICLTTDSIKRNIKHGTPIHVVHCYHIRSDYSAKKVADKERRKSYLAPGIFEYFASDPARDEMPVTMAHIFRFCSISKLDVRHAMDLRRIVSLPHHKVQNFCFRALLKGTMRCYTNEYSDCDKLILIRMLPLSHENVQLKW